VKRAIFVSVGTVVGLTATLRYTPVSPSLDSSSLALGGLDELDSSTSSTPETGSPTPVPTVSESVTSSAKPSSTPGESISAVPAPTTSTSANGTSTKPTPRPATTKPSTPKPVVTKKSTPTPQATFADFTGSIETAGEYGTTQAVIRVSNKKIISVSYVLIPDIHEESRVISFNAIRQLKPKILTAQSAKVSNISGATYTSVAFLNSVASAMAKAGL